MAGAKQAPASSLSMCCYLHEQPDHSSLHLLPATPFIGEAISDLHLWITSHTSSFSTSPLMLYLSSFYLLLPDIDMEIQPWLDCKEIQRVHSEGDQPWDFLGRNDAKAETPVLWPPHAKSWLTGKDSDAGRDWGQEEQGMTEDEMAGWHHWLDGRESGWTPGVGDGQRGLVCCNSWGRKESDTTERLNWTDIDMHVYCLSIQDNVSSLRTHLTLEFFHLFQPLLFLNT